MSSHTHHLIFYKLPLKTKQMVANTDYDAVYPVPAGTVQGLHFESSHAPRG